MPILKATVLVALTLLFLLLLLISGPAWMLATGKASFAGDFWRADRSSAGLAPPPATTPEAVLQVYAAQTFRWRGAFSVHTWVAAKPAGADAYTRYEVIGFRLASTGTAVVVDSSRPADGRWFGAEPRLVHELRGEAAAESIDRLPVAIARYPYAREYNAWPGPNSNTFVAWLLAEAGVDAAVLPPNALGKDWHGGWWRARRLDLPDGRGWSVQGPRGAVALTRLPGYLELGVLGLSFGYAPGGLILPGIGAPVLGGDSVQLPPLPGGERGG